jgi:hypothetical protein
MLDRTPDCSYSNSNKTEPKTKSQHNSTISQGTKATSFIVDRTTNFNSAFAWGIFLRTFLRICTQMLFHLSKLFVSSLNPISNLN